MQWHEGRRWRPCDTVTRGTGVKGENYTLRFEGHRNW
jgi:hypothetical protein